MTEEQKTNWLTEHALFFWQEAEDPDANEMDALFTALAERDVEAIKALFQRHEMDAESTEGDEA